MKILPDAERLQLYDAICEYSLNGKEPESISPIANSLFILMRPNIDSSNKRYRASVENGKKGGPPKGNQNARKQPKNNQTKQPKNKQDYDYDLDSDIDSDCDYDTDTQAAKPPRSRFIPPSVEDVREYCKVRGNNIDPQRFVDYYSSNGWMVGRNKMKDWKAAVRSWEQNERSRTEGSNGQTSGDTQCEKWELPRELVL